MNVLPKPVLRGHIQRRGIKSIVGAITFGCINGALYYLFAAVPKKQKYDDFLKTYDPDVHYEELARKGYLQSAKLIASKANESK